VPDCPNGHSSATADYCDQCGAKIVTTTVEAATADGAVNACPNCQSPYKPDDKFCEVCGYDFATGTLPAAPVPVAATTTAAPSGSWEAVVNADRHYWERTSASAVSFPDNCPERVFTLSADEALIGRRSESRGIHPQIDLSGAPEDTAVSRSHALLRRQPDGGWTLTDPGSTNGTWLNDDPSPVEHGVAIPIAAGDRIYVGAWTRIDLRQS
jgi:FHA domain/Double zinc ribbon